MTRCCWMPSWTRFVPTSRGAAWIAGMQDLLVLIPFSFEEHPRVVEFVHKTETLDRLHRLHNRFGLVLRQEQVLRQIDSLDH